MQLPRVAPVGGWKRKRMLTDKRPPASISVHPAAFVPATVKTVAKIPSLFSYSLPTVLATHMLRFLALFMSLLSLQFLHAVLVCRDAVAYFNPLDRGGSMLDDSGNGLGEPLNVIISALSSAEVLTDSGFLNFARSLDLSSECLGLHLGNPFSSNLGDGNGAVNQTTELRQDFGNSGVGSCLESLTGGNHLRVYRQNGSIADSGALFLAVSQEEDVFENHTISPDGYDKGRDALVAMATAGETSFDGVTYSTTSENITGLLTPGSDGINHGIAIDGVVKLLTVTIV